jgi:hypothetical protein
MNFWTDLQTNLRSASFTIELLSPWPVISLTDRVPGRHTTILRWRCVRGNHTFDRPAEQVRINLHKNGNQFSCHECAQRNGKVKGNRGTGVSSYGNPNDISFNGTSIDTDENGRRSRALAPPLEGYKVVEQTLSLPFQLIRPNGKIMLSENEKGYDRYVLSGTNHLKYRIGAHQLALRAFAPDKEERKYAVDHLNHDRSDQRIENLCPATSAENGRKISTRKPGSRETVDFKVPDGEPAEEWREIRLSSGSIVLVSSWGRFKRPGSEYITIGYLPSMSKYLMYAGESVAPLVCQAFHGVRPAGFVCDHINRVPTDNRASNLRWTTGTDNNLNRTAGKPVIQYITADLQPTLWEQISQLEPHPLDTDQLRVVAVYPTAVIASQHVGVTDGAINTAVKNTMGSVSVGCRWAFHPNPQNGRQIWFRLGGTSAPLLEGSKQMIQVQRVDAYGKMSGEKLFFPSISNASSVLECKERDLSDTLKSVEGGAMKGWWFTIISLQENVVFTTEVPPINPDPVVDPVQLIEQWCAENGYSFSRSPTKTPGRRNTNFIDCLVNQKKLVVRATSRGGLITFSVKTRVRKAELAQPGMIDVVCAMNLNMWPGRICWMTWEWFRTHLPTTDRVRVLPVGYPMREGESDGHWCDEMWDKGREVLGDPVG